MREQSYKILNNSQSNDIRGGETKVMKKLLTSFLVLALLLTMVTPAFANTTQENLGDYATAVERLGVLEILKGYEDGTFRVDNTITRAEFAAVAVRLLGLEASAKAAQGATQFKDKVDTWATGYINIAAQQGVLTGYPDGTIGATKPVTQAEALAMLIRVLGYEPSVSKQGWPYNYVVKAQQIGLSADLDVAANTNATRGFVAQASDNALFIDKMVQTGVILGEPTYSVVEGNTVLKNNLGATQVKGQVVDAYFLDDSTLDEGIVTVDTDGTGTANENIELFDTTGISVDVLFSDVTFWVKNDVAFYAEWAAPGTAVTGVLNVTGTNITVGTSTTVYDATSAVVAVNLDDTKAVADLNGLYGTLYVNSKKEVKAAVANDYTTPVFVKGLNEDADAVVLKDLNEYDLETTLFVKNNVVVSGSDLTENDIAYVYSDNKDIVYVVDNKVTGEFTKVGSTGKYFVNGTYYSIYSPVFSTDNGEDFGNVATATDFLGENVVAYLGGDGKVVALSAAIDTVVPVNYAYFNGNTDTILGKDYAEFLTLDGTVKYHELKLATGEVLPGSATLVDLQFNTDGTVKSADVVNAAKTGTFDVTDNNKYIVSVTDATPTTTLYSVSKDAVVIDSTNEEVGTWEDLQASIDGVTHVGSVVINSAGVVVAIELTAGNISALDTDTALVVTKFVDKDGYKVELNIDGTLKVYEVANGTLYTNLTAGTIGDYVLTGGELTSFTVATTADVVGTVKSYNTLSGQLVVTEAGGDTTVFLDKDVIVYVHDTNNGTVEYTTASAIAKSQDVQIDTDASGYAVIVKIVK